MSKEILTALHSPLRIKYRDIFDLKGFYIFLHEWLMEHEWIDSEGDEDHWETYHYEKIWTGNVKEIYLHWRVSKKAKQGHFQYYLDFNWHCLGLTKTEVVKEGHKLSIDKGEIEIYIYPYIEERYKSFFDENSLIKPFKKLFTRRIYTQTIDFRKKELYQETYALHNAIKQWFKMKRYLPYEESKSLYTSKAWPSNIKEK